MARTLLSVVMPTHNRTDQLERAARSVLSQEMADLELIIVDDASDVDNGAVIDRIAGDRRVRTVRNPESLGPGGARDQGIAVARGGSLGFCDDDDAWGCRGPPASSSAISSPIPCSARCRPGTASSTATSEGRRYRGRGTSAPTSSSGATSWRCRSPSSGARISPTGVVRPDAAHVRGLGRLAPLLPTPPDRSGAPGPLLLLPARWLPGHKRIGGLRWPLRIPRQAQSVDVTGVPGLPPGGARPAERWARAMARRLAEEAAASPLAAETAAASAIGCWSVSSTIGIRRSDPARPLGHCSG